MLCIVLRCCSRYSHGFDCCLNYAGKIVFREIHRIRSYPFHLSCFIVLRLSVYFLLILVGRSVKCVFLLFVYFHVLDKQRKISHLFVS